jgi:hypothetical protein
LLLARARANEISELGCSVLQSVTNISFSHDAFNWLPGGLNSGRGVAARLLRQCVVEGSRSALPNLFLSFGKFVLLLGGLGRGLHRAVG